MNARVFLTITMCICLASLPEAVFSQTVKSKQSATNAFSSLKKARPVKAPGARGKTSTRIDIADLPLLPGSTQQHITGAVKIWAVRADASGRETSGPVSILHEKWQPNDYLYFYIETASPLMVSLYQLYPLTGYPGQNESRTVIPNDNFPTSFDPIEAGSAVRMPLLMKMDNTRADEEIAFSFLTLDIVDNGGIIDIGDPILDDPPIDFIDDIGGEGGSMSFRGKIKNFAERAGKAALRKQIPTKARIDIVGDGGMASSSNVDDVAVTAVFCGRIAFIKLTMHKD